MTDKTDESSAAQGNPEGTGPAATTPPSPAAARRKGSAAAALGRTIADTVWKRPAQPGEIAPTFVYLASDDSRYLTGEIIGITGRATTR